jgi:amino acid transporter
MGRPREGVCIYRARLFGFESCLTVAEETRNPRRNLPIALVGSVTLAGLWFSFAMYAVVIGFGRKHMDKLAASSEPLRDLAVRYIGPPSIGEVFCRIPRL